MLSVEPASASGRQRCTQVPFKLIDVLNDTAHGLVSAARGRGQRPRAHGPGAGPYPRPSLGGHWHTAALNCDRDASADAAPAVFSSLRLRWQGLGEGAGPLLCPLSAGQIGQCHHRPFRRRSEPLPKRRVRHWHPAGWRPSCFGDLLDFAPLAPTSSPSPSTPSPSPVWRNLNGCLRTYDPT